MKRAEPGITRVGVIGLGKMGNPMATRIAQGGFQLGVFNRTSEKARALVAIGATAFRSPAELAATSDVVLTIVSDSEDVRQVMTGPTGVLQGAPPGLVWIDMSTISPNVTRELGRTAAMQQVESIDAPVSGGPPGAESGTLSIMAGGHEEVFEAILPILQTLGSTILLMGDLGAGQITKACNQIMVAANLSGVAEGLVFAAKAGIDPARVRQALVGGYAQSRILEVHGERMIGNAFEPGFSVRLHSKDLQIVLQSARELETATPIAAIVAQHFNALIASGEGELDNSAIVRVYERLACKSLIG